MTLIDDCLPDCQFREVHACRVPAPPARVLTAASACRPEDDALFRALLTVRAWPGRLADTLLRTRSRRRHPFGLDAFAWLGRSSDALVCGLTGAFWRPDLGLVPAADLAAFRAQSTPRITRVMLGFHVHPLLDGQTRLVTETRVFCPDAGTLRAFRPYWLVIRPASGFLRRRALAAIRTRSIAGPPA